MKLIKNGNFVEQDFTAIGADDALPDGAVIVPLERWEAERDSLVTRNTPIGVKLGSGQHPERIRGDLDHLSVVALDFPIYRNGRAYSYARLLRDRYGYDGEIRAVGNVLQDQFYFMVRCGFDALEVQDKITPEIYEQSVGVFTYAYQPSSDDRPTVMSLRHRLAARANEARAAAD